MANSLPYPPSPGNVPESLTKANVNFKKHAWLAMVGLMFFMAFYFVLMTGFGLIAYRGAMAINTEQADMWQMLITVSAMLLTIFMVKSLFAVRKAGDPGGVEVSREEEPALFEFLHTLADEIGAPRPHRVFLTPEVNAAVFYDLSVVNLLFPSKKNLIIGLGLVNVLNLGEFKAVLAHEFGHFAQGSMMVGRWVYIAQQIIAHMVATRDWLDSIVRFISRIDLRIAWVGWILALILWSIRSLIDTLFSVVIMAERALSREMEFNADLVAVSVTGSDALINALHKLQAADHAWQTALNVASNEAGEGKIIDDLFQAQKVTVSEMRRILDDKLYGNIPIRPGDSNADSYRVFTEETARPPQMWATHPANRDREDNAKATYIAAELDDRSAWDVFSNPTEIKQRISKSFYNAEKAAEFEAISPMEAVIKRFNKAAYSPEYRGTYLNRSAVRNFSSVDDMLSSGELGSNASDSIASIYPKSIVTDLDTARNLDIERETLEALERGELKPSGGVIRHRGEELKKSDIPDAIQEIIEDRKIVAGKLKTHDASCRRAHLQLAEQMGQGWPEYLTSLIHLLHCSEHMWARLTDEEALFVNTWTVITADGQIGFFEKRRMIKVCKNLHVVMNEISARAVDLQLPQPIVDTIGIDNWAEQCPQFELLEVDKKNWGEWCQAASEQMGNLSHALGILQNVTLDELIKTEAALYKHLVDETTPEVAPAAGQCPEEYPLLIPGNENVLQRKLDLWNRFQLAHGVFPTLSRLLISLGIVGGTIYGGLTGL